MPTSITAHTALSRPAPSGAAERISLADFHDWLVAHDAEAAEWHIDARQPLMEIRLVAIRPRGTGGPVKVTRLG